MDDDRVCTLGHEPAERGRLAATDAAKRLDELKQKDGLLELSRAFHRERRTALSDG